MAESKTKHQRLVESLSGAVNTALAPYFEKTGEALGDLNKLIILVGARLEHDRLAAGGQKINSGSAVRAATSTTPVKDPLRKNNELDAVLPMDVDPR